MSELTLHAGGKDVPRCQGRIWGGWHTHQCTKRGKLTEDGKTWCGIHAPSAQKRREEKSMARYAAQAKADVAAANRRKRQVVIRFLEEHDPEGESGLLPLAKEWTP